jgi:Fe-S cluster assembly protein SufD
VTAVPDSWRRAHADLQALRPASERAWRAAALDRFLAAGLPTRDQEAWRYTDLAGLAAQDFALAPAPAALPDLSAHFLPGCDRLVFVDGHPVPALSASALDPAVFGAAAPASGAPDDALADLNRAFAVSGLALRVPPGVTLPRPLQVIFASSGAAVPRMAHLAHTVELGRSARATLLLQHVGSGAAVHFSTHALAGRLEDGARLSVVRVQDEGTATTQLFRGDLNLQRDAALHLVNVDLGGALVRNDWNVELAARGASAIVDGLYAPQGSAHVDNHTRIDHRCPHGTSRETFRGIVGDRARAVFNGRVVVHAGAQKTDSEQRIANLLLAPGAEVNAKPELEIYADDVKCAHGATVGQLDANAIFYLRSRGLPADLARALLTYTFAWEILGRIEPAELRRPVERAFLARLPAGLPAESLL